MSEAVVQYPATVRASWCTRDWIGGSSYSAGGFRSMLRTVWASRHENSCDRQAPQWSLTLEKSGPDPWRDSYVLLVDFKMFDVSLEAWPGWRGGVEPRPKIRYLHLNPRYWRSSNWFKDRWVR